MSREHIESDILQTLAERAPLHVTDLTEQVDNHPVAVDQACARLHDDGYIFPSGHGVYDITDCGQRRLDELVATLEE